MLTRYETADGIARITLARPEKRNALSPELIADLRASLAKAAADPAIRVILLRGDGPDFCAGLDLSGLAVAPDDAMAHFDSARSLVELYLAMRHNPKTIIAAVQGRAIGGGAGLATASDLILASASSQFRYPEVNLGFIAAVVMSMVRRLVGEKRAFEIVALGEAIPAQAALGYGMVNHVLPDADFGAKVEAYAAEVASKSASALTLTKDMLYHIDGMTFDAAIHAGLYGNALARMTPDARRGFESFTKKK